MMTLQTFGARLGDARDFVEVATEVCDAVQRLFDARCGVALHRASAGPVVLVDSFGAGNDRYRLATVTESLYRGGPLFSALRDLDEELDVERFVTLARDHGFVGDYGHPLVLPLVDTSGLVGSIQCARGEPYAAAPRRDLATMATLVSVRLAQLCIMAVAGSPTLLTPRQHETARLAALGATNLEIASALQISANTVKKLLKQVFARLGVENRTELAVELPRAMSSVDVRAGMNRQGTLAVSCSA